MNMWMKWSLRKSLMLAGVIAALLPLPAMAADAPKVTITLKNRHGHGVPNNSGCSHTGGGNVIVEQTKDDTVSITCAGVAVAGVHPSGSCAGFEFTVEQCFEIAFAAEEKKEEKKDEKAEEKKPDPPKRVKLTVDAVVIGLLRGDARGGCASVCNGAAAISSGGGAITQIALEPHSVCGCENLSINDHVGPVSAVVGAGDYSLHQTFSISATHSRGILGKAASAEFAPDPALDPLWISYWEPFHGAAKKDFGFKVTYHVELE